MCEPLSTRAGRGLRPRPDRCLRAYGPLQPSELVLVYVVYGLTIIWLEYVGASFGS